MTAFGLYQIHEVFQKTTPDIQSKIIDFWTRNHAGLSAQEMQNRVHQVVLVLQNDKSDVVGVSSAYAGDLAHIGRDDPKRGQYYFYRMFIQPSARMPHLMLHMMNTAYDVLQNHAMQAKAAGFIIVAENKKLTRPGMLRVFARNGYILDGADPRGYAVFRRDFV